MKDKNNIPLTVGDKAIAQENGEEFLVTIEVIKTDKKGEFFAEVTNENYDVFSFGSKELVKQ